MALTTAQFQAWLESNSAIRCLLVEVIVNISGTETTLYFSNRNYNTGPSDSPANTSYQPIVQTSLSFNQSLPLDGTASLSYGDIAIDNTNGERDSWLDYTWANREINLYMGDVTAPRGDFVKIYSGYVQDIASSSRNTLNLSIRDVLQRLNTPVSATLVGGSDQNSGQLRPLVFGEVHNITPVLVDSANLIYMAHNGPIERIIEVRDNGVPITSYTAYLNNGTFMLNKAPAGTITCSVQGERSAINRATGGVISHNYSPANLTWTRNGTTATVTHTAHGFATGASINITSSSATTTIPLGTYTITVVNANSYTITCLFPENMLIYSEEFDNAAWLKYNLTVTANAITAPDTTTTADKLVDTLSTSNHGLTSNTWISLNGNTATFSVYAKAAELSQLDLWIDNGSGTGVTATFDLVALTTSVTRAGAPTIFTNTTSAITASTTGWYRCSITSTQNGTITGNWGQTRIYLRKPGGTSDGFGSVSYTGTGTSGLHIWGAQLSTGSQLTTYFKNTAIAGTPSGTASIKSYANTVAELIQIITQKYGTTPLLPANLDLTTFNSFDIANQAPVGIYLTANTNVISLCQDLAASLGAQFTSNKTGLVTLLKLDTPIAGTVSITDNDIIANSCSIEQKVPVQGAVKLGYCKNWTIQTQLLTGIPEAHKTMLGLEYLTATATDSATLSAYSQSAEPQQKNTYLISNSPTTYVLTEATRLLNLWKTPRYIYKLEGTAKFLTLNLGDMVSLTHYRFGLSGTKYGQVVSIAVNWDTGRVNLGILV